MPSRSASLYLIVLAVTLTLAGGGQAAAGAAPSTPLVLERSTPLPAGRLSALGPRPGGAIELVGMSGVGRSLALERRTWPADEPLSGGQIQAGPRSRDAEEVAAAVTSFGAVVAFGAVRDRKRRVLATTFGAVGEPADTQVISPRGISAREPEVTTGGGAVAITFAGRDRASEQAPTAMLAFRGVGQRRFGRAQAIDGPAPEGHTRYAIALGPRGSGAIVAAPVISDDPAPLRVRRIAADGTLGPWIPVGTTPFDGFLPAAAVSASGTVAIAALADVAEDPARGTARATGVLASSLPAGATQVTPTQLLSVRPRGPIFGLTIEAAIGGHDETIVVTGGSTTEEVVVNGGPAGNLRELGAFRALQPTAAAAVTTDGVGVVAWGSLATVYGGAAPLQLAQHERGAELGPPVAVARTRFDAAGRDTAIEPGALVALPRGRVGLAVSDHGRRNGRAKLLVFAPSADAASIR